MTTATALLEALGPVGGDFDAARAAGARAFLAAGLPTRKLEDWRFTELRPLGTWRPGGTTDRAALDAVLAAPTSPHQGGGARIVLVDGRFDPVRSEIDDLPSGIFFGAFKGWAASNEAEAIALLAVNHQPAAALVALNAAVFTDGFVLDVPAGIRLAHALRIVHWNTGGAAQTRSLIRLGADAVATIAEEFRGERAGFTNAALSIELGAGARLGWTVLQTEASDAIHYAHAGARIAAKARLDGFVLNLGARLARTDFYPSLDEAGGHCGFSGASVLGGRQDATVAAIVTHRAPGCTTREVFKTCLAGEAHGAFQGRIVVEQAAQKTDAYQLAKTLLLGERAVMDVKPELEIYADDVKCSHGATVGDLDETAMFYCRSRGIPPDEARALLIQAFLEDALAEIADDALRAPIAAALHHRLAEMGAGLR